MFKKLGLLVMSILLLVSNFSGAMSIHYCHGEPHKLKVEVLELQKTFVKELSCCCHEQQVTSCCYNQSYDEVFSNSFRLSDQEDSDFTLVFLGLEPKPLALAFSENMTHKTTYFYCKQANSPPLYKLYSKYILYA